MIVDDSQHVEDSTGHVSWERVRPLLNGIIGGVEVLSQEGRSSDLGKSYGFCSIRESLSLLQVNSVKLQDKRATQNMISNSLQLNSWK